MKMQEQILKIQPRIEVHHKGDVLSFAANIFTKKAFEENGQVFDHINRYWASLPDEQQDAIFEIYREIYRGFDQIPNGDDLAAHLREQIVGLIYHHPLEKLRLWLSMDTSILIPDSIPDEFEASIDRKNTREKTYTKPEYMELVALGLFFRTLMPVWGEYTNMARTSYGIEVKEYIALQLLIDTSLLECPAMEKLNTYVRLIAADKHKNFAHILNSVSSEDVNFLLLSMVCVRRLCSGDLRGLDNKTHLVSKVHKFLLQKVSNSQETTSEIRIKEYQKDNSADNSKRSIMESYRKRAELSLGEIAEIEYSYEDLHGIALRLAPEITEAEIDAAIDTISKAKNERFGNIQLDLMARTFKTVLSPKTNLYIPKSHVLGALALLECVLWHWGHKYLALLSTSYMVVGYDEMLVTPISNRAQISDELKNELKIYYPYIWSSVKRGSGDLTPEIHPVLHEIDLTVDELTSNAWRMTASDERIQEVFHEPRRRLALHADIKSDLARLIIDIERRRTLSIAA